MSSFAADDSAEGVDVTKSGQYVIYDGDDYETPVSEVAINLDGANKVTVRIYSDTNSNGKYDDGEPLMEDYSTLQLKKESEVAIYGLDYGWNLISIPLVSSDGIDTASELLESFNEQGADVKHVAKFAEGSFVMYTNREGEQEYSNDFNLVPGYGYFVLNYQVAEVKLKGNKFDEAVPFRTRNGWNLVGVYTNEQDYTAEELIEDMRAEGIEVSTVSKYESGLYTNLAYEDETVYGNDYNLYERVGYFVQVQSGGGDDVTFTPKPGDE